MINVERNTNRNSTKPNSTTLTCFFDSTYLASISTTSLWLYHFFWTHPFRILFFHDLSCNHLWPLYVHSVWGAWRICGSGHYKIASKRMEDLWSTMENFSSGVVSSGCTTRPKQAHSAAVRSFVRSAPGDLTLPLVSGTAEFWRFVRGSGTGSELLRRNGLVGKSQVSSDLLPPWVLEALVALHRFTLAEQKKHRPKLVTSMGRLYIYLHEWLMFMVHVGKYTINGSYGKCLVGILCLGCLIEQKINWKIWLKFFDRRIMPWTNMCSIQSARILSSYFWMDSRYSITYVYIPII